jgi:AcrR family transcriptional regulator
MDRIEQCAIEFLSKPINDITVAALAQQAEVSQVSIYNYYGSKEALLKEALKRLFDEKLEEFRQLFESSLPFDVKLKQSILSKRQSSAEIHPDTYTSLIAGDAEMQSFMTRYSQEHSIPLFLQFIQQGRESGRIRDSVLDETLILYLNLFSQVLAHLGEAEFNQLNQTSTAESLTDMFFYGIFNQHDQAEEQ